MRGGQGLSVAGVVDGRRRISVADPHDPTELPTVVRQTGWAALPPELLEIVCAFVVARFGSGTLVKLAGTCRAWRETALNSRRSILGQTMTMFRYNDPTVSPSLQPYFTAFNRFNRLGQRINTNSSVSVTPSVQDKYFTPRRWPPTDWSPTGIALAVLSRHPGTFLAGLSTMPRGAYGFKPRFHWDIPNEDPDAITRLECPLLPADCLPFSVPGGSKNICVETRSDPVHIPVREMFGWRTGSYTLSLCPPVPNHAPTSTGKPRHQQVLNLTVSTDWFRGGENGGLATGIFRHVKSAGSSLGQGRIRGTRTRGFVYAEEESVSFLVVFVRRNQLDPNEPPSPEDRAMCEREMTAGRPWIAGAIETLDKFGASGALANWLAPRVVGSMVLLKVGRARDLPVAFDTDIGVPASEIKERLRAMIGPIARDPDVFTSVEFTNQGDPWRLGSSDWSVDSWGHFCRVVARLEWLGKQFVQKYPALMNSDVGPGFPHNRRACSRRFRRAFADFWALSLLRRPTEVWTPSDGVAVLFAVPSFYGWIRNQPSVFVDRSIGTCPDGESFKYTSAMSIEGSHGHILRDGRQPKSQQHSHEARFRTYFSPEVAIFGSPFYLMSLVGTSTQATRAVVPLETTTEGGWFVDFPVWGRWARQPDLPAAEVSATIRMCREMAGSGALLRRVPVIMGPPDVSHPGFISMRSVYRAPDARHPAWDAQPPIGTSEDGIRVSAADCGSGTDDEADDEAGVSVPVAVTFQHGDVQFRVRVHHVIKSPDGNPDRDTFFGTVEEKNATLAASSGAVDALVPIDISLGEAHTVTTHGIVYMALDIVADKLLAHDLGAVIGPELTAFVAHMALVLTLPADTSDWGKQYRREARRQTERFVEGLSRARPDSRFQPSVSAPDAETIRLGHPLTVLSANQLKRQKTAEDLAPLLSPFLLVLTTHLQGTSTEPGWARAIARHYIEQVQSAFNLWAVDPQCYYDRLCLHADRLEAHVNATRTAAAAGPHPPTVKFTDLKK